MLKLNTKNRWVPIEFDPNSFANGAEGLIGVEECHDYDLQTILASKTRKNKKRKQVVEDEIPDEADDFSSTNEDNKKLKSKKKKKRKVTQVLHEVIKPSLSGSVEECEDAEVESENEDVELTDWSFVPLPKPLLKALADQGFTKPTEIQSLTLPPAILGRRDILGAAETGSGKTLAFGLPILNGILNLEEDALTDETLVNKTDITVESDEELELCDELADLESDNDDVSEAGSMESLPEVNTSLKPLYALILTPTRELAVQIKNHLVAAAKYTDVKVAVIVGGMAAVKQERVLSKGPQIVVATPGRLWELIEQGNQHLSQIENLRYLAIDETDRMVEKGHFQELHLILEKINADPDKMKLRQNFVFSATLTLVHELPNHLLTKKKLNMRRHVKDLTPSQKLQKLVETLGITDPKVVDITKAGGTSGTLTECRITCSMEEKDYYVYYFLKKHPGRTLIFCNSIGCVKRLTTLMGLLDCNPFPLHASMQQRQRLKNLDRFREKENSILIATDVAARGLDIQGVEHVLHYQMPRTGESYVHRSGRTARASKQGITILLIEPSEIQNYLRLCRTLKKSEDIPLFPIDDKMLNAVKERVNLARELDKLDLQVRKVTSETGWLEKAAKEMDILVDMKFAKTEQKEANAVKKRAEVKKKQLAQLLAKPVFPKNFSGKFPLTLVGGTIQMNNEKETTALTVMKTAIDNFAKVSKTQRSKAKSLFKPKVKAVDGKIELNKNAKQNGKGKGFRGKNGAGFNKKQGKNKFKRKK